MVFQNNGFFFLQHAHGLTSFLAVSKPQTLREKERWLCYSELCRLVTEEAELLHTTRPSLVTTWCPMAAPPSAVNSNNFLPLSHCDTWHSSGRFVAASFGILLFPFFLLFIYLLIIFSELLKHYQYSNCLALEAERPYRRRWVRSRSKLLTGLMRPRQASWPGFR